MKKYSTKKALLASVLSLLLCVSMLIGTTFAWFTDSVTSNGNKIQSGTLNIDMSVMDETGTYQSVKENSDAIFDYTLWEPGYTVWRNIKVSTTGNLALKYEMNIVLNGERSILADVIDVYYAASEIDKPADRSLTGLTRLGTICEVLDGATGALISDTLIPGTNTEDYATIVLKMQESANNDYQGKTIGEFDINLFATQYTYEEDSFDEKYDAAAPNFMPTGVSAEDFGTNVAYVNGAFYSTLKNALAAIHDNGVEENVIYLKPGADLGTVTHAHVCSNLTIYGNGAFISGGEQDFEIGFPAAGGTSCTGIKNDLTLNVYNLNGAAVWGSVTATLPYDINVNFVGCKDMTKVMVLKNGSTPSYNLNISISDCTFKGTDAYRDSAIYCQNLGTLNISNTTFKDYAVGINQNNKDGVENYTLTDCTFVDCATASNVTTQTSYAAPVRAVASAAGTVTNLTLTNCKFVYTGSETAINGDILTYQDGNAGTVNLINN